jgi:hypothetical protein
MRVTAMIFALGSSCLLLSLTRSCWIGFLGGSLYLVARAMRGRSIKPSRVMALAAAGLVALVVAWRPVHERLGANHEGAFEERWRLNYAVLGVGLNNAFDSRARYLPSFFGPYDWIYIAHNQFLHVAAETGIVGLVPFIWVLWRVLRALRRARRTREPLLDDTVTVLKVSLWSMIWGMNLDFYAGMQMYTVLWFMLGASSGVALLVARESERENPRAVAVTEAA